MEDLAIFGIIIGTLWIMGIFLTAKVENKIKNK